MANGCGVCACICCLSLVCLATVAAVLFVAYVDIDDVKVTVEEASLDQLSLAAPAVNGTASLTYNLSLAVSVSNPNWAARVWRTAPLDAELRLAGRPFALIRLAGAEVDRIRAGKSKVYRVAVGSDGVAAFARESAVGVFELELIIAGKFKYQTHRGGSSTTVWCLLKLPLSTVAKAVAFAAFEHTLPPQPCVAISNVMDISKMIKV